MYWLLHTLVGGGLLLLLAWALFARIGQPARRLRLGEWAITAALLLAVLSLMPAWLVFRLPEGLFAAPVPAAQPVADLAATAPEVISDNDGLFLLEWTDLPQAAGFASADPLPPIEPQPTEPTPAPSPVVAPFPILDTCLWAVGVAYAGVAAFLLGRWLVGQCLLARLLAQAEPVPDGVASLCLTLTKNSALPRLLTARRVRVPFSCGLLRPTVVLPAELCADAASPALRWVLAHELAHLRHRDAWAALLFGVGQAVYFPLPWFWWLRRQVRLCQEYLADAAAVADSGRREDYAQFLLGWAAAPPLPVGATGVSGHSSDLFRRITMLLQTRRMVDGSCPRLWSLPVAGGLLALAVLVAGVGLPSGSAQADDKKPDPKKDDPRPDREDNRRRDLNDDQMVNELLLDYARDFRRLLNDVRRDNFENPYGIYRPRQPAVMVPGRVESSCLPTPLGASVEKIGPALADQLDLKAGQGLLVCKVTEGTPAAKSGLRAHDVVLEVNGKDVPNDVGLFLKVLDDFKVDAPFDVLVLRKGKRETLKGMVVPGAKARSDARPVDDAGPVQAVALEDPHPLARQVAAATAPLVAGRIQSVPGKGAVQTMSVRTGDKFTSRFQEGCLLIDVTGKVADGKSTPGQITVRDADGAAKYAEVDQVPEKYRGKVKTLVEINELNNLRVTLRKK